MHSVEPIDSGAALVRVLRELALLDETDLNELRAPGPDPRVLGQRLVERGLLTGYQLERLLAGRGPELVLGQYLLLEPLGEGGMGQVFKARHRLMHRLVALKVIRPQLLDKPDALRRFRREIRAVAQLSHPNIVTAHDAEQVGDTHFLVMEYCAGQSLSRLVRTSGPLRAALACECVRQAALGLQHAFERGLVHRDVKPENLLMTSGPQRTGLGGVVKVLDLGLACFEPDAPAVGPTGALTQEGAILGTPDYIAPEQARNLKDADIRSDLYSLGCTLYFLLAGQMPFPGGTMVEKLLRHQLEEPAPLERLRPGLPPAVLEIVRRLMAKDPAQRYQTPADLAAALTPFAQTEALSGSVATPGDMPATSPYTPSALFPLPGSTSPSSYEKATAARKGGATQAPPAVSLTPLVAKPGPRRRSRWLLAAGAAGALALIGVGIVLSGLGGASRNGGNPPSVRPPERPAVLPPGTVPDRWRAAATLTPHKDEVLALALSRDGKRLATGCGIANFGVNVGPGEVKVWNLESRQPEAVFAVPAGPARCVAFAPDGTTVAWGVGNWDLDLPGEVGIRDLSSGRARKITAHATGVYGVAFHPHRPILATGGRDHLVRLWDTGTGKLLAEGAGHSGKVDALAFSPDGRLLASAGEDRSVRLWDGDTGKFLRSMDGLASAWIPGVAFTPDGSRLAAASGVQDGNPPEVRLWDVKAGHLIWSISQGECHILSLAVAPDGQTLATGDQDGNGRVLDLRSGKERSTFRTGSAIWSLGFAADGQRLAAGCSDGTVRLFEGGGK